MKMSCHVAVNPSSALTPQLPSACARVATRMFDYSVFIWQDESKKKQTIYKTITKNLLTV